MSSSSSSSPNTTDGTNTSAQQVKVAMLRLMSDFKAAQNDPPSVS